MGRKQYFLNVDLEITSKHKVDQLTLELDKRLTSIWRGKNRGVEHAHYEVPGIIATPEVTIQAFIREIDKLSPAAMKEWNAAKLRELSIGVQGGQTPRVFALPPIAPEVLAECARLKMAIGYTVYGPID